MLDFEDMSVFFDDVTGIGDKVLVGKECEEVEVVAIFSNPYQELSDAGYVNVSSRQPMLTFQQADVDDLEIATGTRVVVEERLSTGVMKEVVYYVRTSEPDGTGLVRMMLRKG